jgi:hypothetical protein
LNPTNIFSPIRSFSKPARDHSLVVAAMKWTLLFGGLALLLAYNAMSVTIPKGCAQPWRIRMVDTITGPVIFFVSVAIQIATRP